MATLRGGAPGIWWTQASDAAKHLTIHRTAPPTKRDPAPNVTSARGEKLAVEWWVSGLNVHKVTWGAC